MKNEEKKKKKEQRQKSLSEDRILEGKGRKSRSVLYIRLKRGGLDSN